MMRRTVKAALISVAVVGSAHGLNWLLAPLVPSHDGLRLPGLATVAILAPGLLLSMAADPHFDLKGDGYSSPWLVVLMVAINLAFWFGIAWAALWIRGRKLNA